MSDPLNDNRGIHGLGKECSNLPTTPALTFGGLVWSQHGKRIAMRAVEDGFQFLRSHAQLLWQRVVSIQELGTVSRE